MTHIERESGLSTSTPNLLPGHVSEYVMRKEEYEKAYREAREVLYNRGKQVGAPRPGADSIRHCTVDGLLLNDRDVLKEAWGERLADEILVTRRHLKIVIEQQMAIQKWILQRSLNLRPCLKQAVASPDLTLPARSIVPLSRAF